MEIDNDHDKDHLKDLIIYDQEWISIGVYSQAKADLACQIADSMSVSIKQTGPTDPYNAGLRQLWRNHTAGDLSSFWREFDKQCAERGIE